MEQLSSLQEQVLTLQAELAIYQKLLEEATSPSSPTDGGAKASAGGSEGGRGGRGLLDEKTTRLLEEVSRLREQLDGSIRSNHTLYQQLRSRLDRTYTDGHTSTDGGAAAATLSRADKAVGTDSSFEERGSGGSVQTQYTVKANVTTSGFQTGRPRGVLSSATEALTSPSLSPSLSPAYSSPKFSPKSQHHTREFAGTQTSPPRNSRTNLNSSSSSSFFSSHGSSIRIDGEAAGEGARGGGGGGSRRRPSPHHCTHFSFQSFGGNFETLEGRLQKALDSSSLQVCHRLQF